VLTICRDAFIHHLDEIFVGAVTLRTGIIETLRDEEPSLDTAGKTWWWLRRTWRGWRQRGGPRRRRVGRRLSGRGRCWGIGRRRIRRRLGRRRRRRGSRGGRMSRSLR